MKQIKRIIVAGNGPSAYCDSFGAVDWDDTFDCYLDTRVFRTNYFYLNDGDPLAYRVTDWFICEDIPDCRAVRAATRFRDAARPTIWLPGCRDHLVEDITKNHLPGFDIRIQKHFARLPDGCRWTEDLAPERPLMGSFALAVAVGMNPKEIVFAGHDLFQHSSKETHAGTDVETRSWQTRFNEDYLANRHPNHRLSGDIGYVRAALRAYRGELTSFGSVMADLFRDEFPAWNWLEG